MGAEEAGDPAALSGRLFGDLAGALELLTMYLGERLGLYQAQPWAPEGRPEFNRAVYLNLLARQWLPAIADVDLRLRGEPPAATGAVMRPATLRGYAAQAGFRDTEILPVQAGTLRLYRLTP
jgi:hypothetical protein